MGKSINRVDLLGNVGQAPEVKDLESGSKVANFSVATSRYQGKDKEEATDWHRIVAWDNEKGQKLASLVEKYVGKGDKIHVTGRLQTRKYDKDGVTHYSTEIVASDIVLLGSKREDIPSGTALPSAAKVESFDDYPAALKDEPQDLPF